MKPAKKQQKHRRIQNLNIGLWISCIFSTIGIALFLWIDYFCPDARYVRDNLNYVTQQIEEAGISAPPSPSLLAPLPLNMSHLLSVTESWTSGYLQVASNYENLNSFLIVQNPYDTFSRLFLYGNMEDVQALYQNIAYCSAICSPEITLNKNILAQWSQDSSTYQKALQGCAGQAKLMIFLLVWFFFWFLISIIINSKRHRDVSSL